MVGLSQSVKFWPCIELFVSSFFTREWKEKVEIEDHEEDDTITYKKRDVFYFKPELSGPGLTGEEIVVIPHIFLLVRFTSVLTALRGFISSSS